MLESALFCTVSQPHNWN